MTLTEPILWQHPEIVTPGSIARLVVACIEAASLQLEPGTRFEVRMTDDAPVRMAWLADDRMQVDSGWSDFINTRAPLDLVTGNYIFARLTKP